MQPLTQPLTDTEFERLEDFLYSVSPDEAMSIEEMDGFFCALICSPDLVPPSEYLPHLWGEEHVQGVGKFKSEEEAQEILTLISRHWNTIAATLLRDEPYPVLIAEQEDGTMTGQEWALGFLQGMNLRTKPWERLARDKQLGTALLPVAVLSEDDEHRVSPEAVTQKERDMMLDLLAGTVLLIYRYFRNLLKPQQKAKKRSGVKKRVTAKNV